MSLDDLPPPSSLDDLPPPAADPGILSRIGTSILGGLSQTAKTALTPTEHAVLSGAAGVGGALASDVNGLWALANGRNPADAMRATQEAVSVPDPAMASNWNPLNWVGIAAKKAGEKSQDLGASPLAATATEVGVNALPMLFGMRSAKGAATPTEGFAGETPNMPGSVGAAAAEGGGPLKIGQADPLGPPVENGLPKEAQESRAQTLANVGLQNARQSAISGDAKSAAVDYQMTKYDQPAGRAAAAQFQAEKDALASHAEKLIGDTGGTVGMEEDQLANRGQTIAQPFDRLRDWYDQRTKELYDAADQRAQGSPLTNLSSVDQLLKDPTFRNSLMAKNQQGLLSAVENQMQHFRETNPQGFTAQTAEQARQWMNQIWSPDNKWAVGRLKDTIDNDVAQAAGPDIYTQARAMRQLRSQVLDNPKGIAQLFDVDPNTPINRSTPFEKIPDRLAQLPIDQFRNVLDTLKGMPDDIQSDAQAAIGEIKGHLLNKVLQAGTQTSRGVASNVWGADRVSTVLRNNAGKLQAAFQDDPATQQGLKDLHQAGQILRVDQSYPGADAQAANAMKRGLISRTLGHVGGVSGTAVGAALTGGNPLAAGVAGAAGEAAGLSAAAKLSEGAALKSWQKRVVPTKE